MWMSIRTENEEPEVIKLDGPGGTICFSVGEPNGPRGGIWVVQAPFATPDIYIANLSIADFQKVSLHASGRWRFAWTSGHASTNLPKDQDRAIAKWPRPPELVPGWAEAFQVWVIHEDLAPYDGLPAPSDHYFQDACRSLDDVLWIPAPGEKFAIAVHVVIGRADQGEVGFPGYVPLGGFSLARHRGSQEACLLLAARVPLTEEHYAHVEHYRNQALASISVDGIELDSPSIRGYLFGEGTRRVPSFWDIRWQPYPPALLPPTPEAPA